jgi:hypothetical protein
MTDTPAAPDAQHNSDVVKTFAQRDAWSRMLPRQDQVKLSHQAVLHQLALCAHTDKDKLVIDPKYDDLAKAAGCSNKTAKRAIVVAIDIGLVRKARASGGGVSKRRIGGNDHLSFDLSRRSLYRRAPCSHDLQTVRPPSHISRRAERRRSP